MNPNESKKLLAWVRDSGDLASVAFPALGADTHEIRETIRIAHEQRKVMKRPAEAAQTFAESVGVEDAADSRMLPKKRLEVRAALDAAAPYLED